MSQLLKPGQKHVNHPVHPLDNPHLCSPDHDIVTQTLAAAPTPLLSVTFGVISSLVPKAPHGDRGCWRKRHKSCCDECLNVLTGQQSFPE